MARNCTHCCLPRPEQKALAGLVCGVVWENSAVLSCASAAIPGPAQNRSKPRQAQRLLANLRFDVSRAQRHLTARVLRHCQGRVDLLVAATTTGAPCTQGGTCTVCVALAWHGRAVPLVWHTWPMWEGGQDWSRALQAMFAVVQSCLPAEVQVVVLADRGFSGRPLAQAAHARGSISCRGCALTLVGQVGAGRGRERAT